MQTETKPESNADYHSDVSHVSSSMLKTLNESPRLFEARYIKRTLPSKESPAMRIGTAVHCYTLEPDRYADEYIVNTHKNRTVKAYKDWAKTVDGKEILNYSEHAVVESCANSLLSIPVLARLLESDGPVEQSIRAEDCEPGVPCKIRCDKIVIGGRCFVVDIKTVAEWSERKFAYACQDFGYHIQAAHYASIASQHYDVDLPNWSVIFAAVETQAPFRSRGCVLDDASYTKGFEDRYRLLCEYQDRMASGDWSEPNEHELTPITLPALCRTGG